MQHNYFYVMLFVMGNVLKAKIKQQVDFDSPAVEATLNLMVAADAVRARFDGFFAKYEITNGQYNVLRILRGAGADDGHPRCEIAARMLERAPDITRIVDRLEKQHLVKRARSDEDRRLSIAKISRKGLALLERMQPELEKIQHQINEKLSVAEWIALSSICEKIYAETGQGETIKG